MSLFIKPLLAALALIVGMAAQSQEKERAFLLGATMHYSTTLDKGMSPLRYSGMQWGGTLGNHKYGPRAVNFVEGSFAIGGVSPSGNTSSGQRMLGMVDYRHGRKLKLEGPLDTRLWAGASWLTMAHVLEHFGYANNSHNFAFATTLGPSAGAMRNLRMLKRDWKLHGSLDLPLFGISSRPGYAFGAPDGFYPDPDDHFRASLKSLEFSLWNLHRRIATTLALEYPIANGNKLALQYRWDFARWKHFEDNPLYTGMQAITFLLHFNY